MVNEQASKTVNYDILRREVDSTRKLYDELLEKVQGAGLASAMNASNIRVVDPAEVASRALPPEPVPGPARWGSPRACCWAWFS